MSKLSCFISLSIQQKIGDSYGSSINPFIPTNPLNLRLKITDKMPGNEHKIEFIHLFRKIFPPFIWVYICVSCLILSNITFHFVCL